MHAIALTGGTTAREIYKIWAVSEKLQRLTMVNFFFDR